MIAVTGASGYVGGMISTEFAPEGVLRLVRSPRLEEDVTWDFAMPAQELTKKLADKNVTHIIHAAWNMHSSRLDELQDTAVAGSARLLDTAKAIGAKLIFISSISAFAGARSAYGKAKLQVEEAVIRSGGIVLRLGLVLGTGTGGMISSLRSTVQRARFIPMIGDGSTPQYLLPQAMLLSALHAAIEGQLDTERAPITLAIPKPVPFRAILQSLAREANHNITFIPVPWKIFYLAFRCAEFCHIKTRFRSDSVLSFIYQDPRPDFSHQERLSLVETDGSYQYLHTDDEPAS